MILYWPCVSVDTDRTFSISEGLAASTVTPGSTAPVVSLTTPVNPVSCASTRTLNNAVRTTVPNVDQRSSLRLIRSPQKQPDATASDNYRYFFCSCSYSHS